MNLQRRSEDHEEFFVSEDFVKAVVIGAILGGVVALLKKLWRKREHPVHPPIIIKSTGYDPIEIETEGSFDETNDQPALLNGSFPNPKVYKMDQFTYMKYVGVYREINNPPGDLKWYKSGGSLVIRMWLEFKNGGLWYPQPKGPHFVAYGTGSEFCLECCDQLSEEKPTGDPDRPTKRSFANTDQTWRIGLVRVDKNSPINMDGYQKMEIRFADRFE